MVLELNHVVHAMEPAQRGRHRVRFGVFEVDLASGELHKHGLKVKLQDQPFQVLKALIEHPGEIVTREQLRETLWPADTFVDYDNGLNAAVKKLRTALSDSANNPRFVETVDRRGYRFIAPVHQPPRDSAATSPREGASENALSVAALESAGGENSLGATSHSRNASPDTSNPSPEATTAGRSTEEVEERAIPGATRRAEPAISPRGDSRWRSGSPWRSVAWAAATLALAAFTTFVIWRRVTRTAQVNPGRVMLAVLPFENFTGDPEQEYFSDGLTEEMISQLGQLSPERLGVIARTSVMGYKHNRGRLDQIGRELGVQYVLEGSVRRNADSLRITAQLIQVKDQTHLWARSYDRKRQDVLDIQGEVAGAIADQIQLKVEPGIFARHDHAVSAAAYEAYLKGRHFWSARTSEGFHKAIEYFQESIQADPNYAPAYVGLADSYLLLQEYSMVGENESQPKAELAALKALQLDERLAEAHTSLAAMRASFHWDWDGAEKEYRRAIALNPNYATAHQWYAEFLTSMARHGEAIAEMKIAQQLDPLSLITNTVAGEIFYFARRYDDAIQQCRKAIEVDGSFAPAYSFMGQAYEQKRDYQQAEINLTKAINLSGGSPKSTAFLGHVYAMSGRAREAEKILRQVREESKERYVSPLDLALIYGAMGHRDEAFASLEQARSRRDHWLLYLKVDPKLDVLRTDARFANLIQQVGLSSPAPVALRRPGP